jgi:hypothetical protein
VPKRRTLFNPRNRKVLMGSVALFVIVIAITWVLLIFACAPITPLNPDACELSPNLSLLAGAAIGVLTTMGFFYFVDQTQRKIEGNVDEFRKILEKYARAYIVRTCLLNLSDIFKGAQKRPGLEHLYVEPTEENRQKFLGKLDRLYVDKFPNPDPLVRQIYQVAKDHPVIQKENKETFDFTTCEYCKSSNVVSMIQAWLRYNPNPGLEESEA